MVEDILNLKNIFLNWNIRKFKKKKWKKNKIEKKIQMQNVQLVVFWV